MTIWSWTALDEKGNNMTGTCQESSKSLVVERLRKQNLYPLRINKDFLRTWRLQLHAAKSKIYWSKASRKIGLMLEAGIPLVTVLQIMADKENNAYLKGGWKKVCQSVLDGNELGLSIKSFEPPLGIHLEGLLIAGERSGTLTKSFLEISAQLEEEYFFEQKIKTALFYPTLLMGIAVLIIYILSAVVLPMYETLFSGLDAELPTITTLIFNIGSVIPYALIIFLGLMFVYLLVKGKNQTMARLSYLYWLPGIGQIRKSQDIILFCSILQRMLDAGMPLVQALDLLEVVMRGEGMKKIISDLKFEVNEGKRLAPVFLRNSFFPAEAAKMIGVGEESGRLSEMLGHMARIFRKELEEKLQKYAKLLEPFLVIGIAGIVGVVAVGILLPLFEMSMHIR